MGPGREALEAIHRTGLRRMGPPAAEGRPWGRLNLRGGPEATHPRGRRKKGRNIEQTWSGWRTRPWARAIERGAQRSWGRGVQARASKRVQTRMCRYARAHAHAQARVGQGRRERRVGGRHKPGAKAVVDKGRLVATDGVAEGVDAVRARTSGGE